jgi:signal transduction histidine kinase
MRLFAKLALYNTAVRLLLLGGCWLIWPTFVAGLNYGVLAAIVGLMLLIDVGYIHLLLRPLRVLVNRKLRIIQDPGQFDFTPLNTTTSDMRQIDEHINELMAEIKIRFECEKAFTAYAAHELLTPIASLRNRFENIIADEQTPIYIATSLVESQKTLRRLNKIVQVLLRLSRIENQQYLQNETVSVRAVIDEVLHDLDDRIALKGIKVEVVVDTDIVRAKANHSLIYTMLLNLVSNAVRYNAEQGRLTIGRGQLDSHPTLTITDTGPGISADQIATLTHYGRPPKATGNGIGLQLIQAIARSHHIGLTVDSHPNRGTRVTLKFSDNQ